MKYRKSLSYRQERIWRDKIVITEKAVNRFKREFETRLKTPEKEVVEINPVVDEVSDAARAYEAAAENLPEPPGLDVDEIEVKLLELKKFNEKLLAKDKHPRKKVKVQVAEAECEIGVIGVHEIVKKKVDKRRIKSAKLNVKDVDDTINIEDVVKEENSLDSKVEVEEKEIEVIGENLDKIEVVDVNEYKENHVEDETFEDALDEVDVKDAYVTDLEEKKEKNEVEEDETQVVNESLVKTRKGSGDKPDVSPVNVNDEKCGKNGTNFCDKIVPETDPKAEGNSDDELLNKEVLVGDRSEDKVAKGMDALTIVTVLHTILAMLLFCVKSLNEQSLLIARYTNLSQPSVLTPTQPVVPSSSSSLQGSCVTQSRMCCSVSTAITGMVTSMTCLGMAWYEQVRGAMNCVQERMILTIIDFIANEDLLKRSAERKTQK